jgi:hypothetical protein
LKTKEGNLFGFNLENKTPIPPQSANLFVGNTKQSEIKITDNIEKSANQTTTGTTNINITGDNKQIPDIRNINITIFPSL